MGNITPEKANDIGERFIIVPKLILETILDDEIRKEIINLSSKVNVVVLSPSNKNAIVWEKLGAEIINSTNMIEGINKIKKAAKGAYVILNKYDGIDLPNDACRVLVIDGLPNIINMNDKYEKSVVDRSNRIFLERIQKIKQGMGREIRSNSDYCVVFLIGNELTDAIYSHKAYELFSNATRTQFELSQEICESTKCLDDVIEFVNRVLQRDEEWVTISKDNVSQISYSKEIKYDELLVTNRQAFNLCEIGKYVEATDKMCKVANNIDNEILKGYFEQQRAEYVNLYNRDAAQQLLISAKSKNKYLLNPIEGIQYSKVMKKFLGQSYNVLRFAEKENIHNDANQYIFYMNDLLEKLVFEENTHEEFEEAIKLILNLIGFIATRPEKETGTGPDDFCVISNEEYLIIECKNEVVNDTISRHDCNQLDGSYNWFYNAYPMGKGIPIMIHKSNVFETNCSPHKEIRIMTEKLLEKLKNNVYKFCIAFTKVDQFMNSQGIDSLLKIYDLTAKAFVKNYTIDFKIK